MWNRKTKILYIMYAFFAKPLPESAKFPLARTIRAFWAKKICSQFGADINIEHGAFFTPGLSIGDRSGVGINCEVHGQVVIGKNVMMAPEVVIYTKGHAFDNPKKPMIEQGETTMKPVVIEDDVWIGRRVIILPGVRIGHGAVIGAGSIVTKDVGAMTVVAGNPAKVVKKRN